MLEELTYPDFDLLTNRMLKLPLLVDIPEVLVSRRPYERDSEFVSLTDSKGVYDAKACKHICGAGQSTSEVLGDTITRQTHSPQNTVGPLPPLPPWVRLFVL